MRLLSTPTLFLACLVVLAGAVPISAQSTVDRDEIHLSDDGNHRIQRKIMVIGDGSEASLIDRLPSVRRAFLGIELVEITPELRNHFGAPDDAGVLVGGVVDDSPAFSAGLMVGDVLSHVDGEAIRSSGQLQGLMAGYDNGDEVTLGLLRDGQALELQAVLSETDRSVLDIAPFFFGEVPGSVRRRVLPLGGEGEIVIRRDLDDNLFEVQIDSEALRRQTDGLGERMRWTMERRGLHEEQLEERIEELDRRLAELAEALERLSSADDD